MREWNKETGRAFASLAKAASELACEKEKSSALTLVMRSTESSYSTSASVSAAPWVQVSVVSWVAVGFGSCEGSPSLPLSNADTMKTTKSL